MSSAVTRSLALVLADRVRELEGMRDAIRPQDDTTATAIDRAVSALKVALITIDAP